MHAGVLIAFGDGGREARPMESTSGRGPPRAPLIEEELRFGLAGTVRLVRRVCLGPCASQAAYKPMALSGTTSANPPLPLARPWRVACVGAEKRTIKGSDSVLPRGSGSGSGSPLFANQYCESVLRINISHATHNIHLPPVRPPSSREQPVLCLKSSCACDQPRFERLSAAGIMAPSTFSQWSERRRKASDPGKGQQPVATRMSTVEQLTIRDEYHLARLGKRRESNTSICHICDG